MTEDFYKWLDTCPKPNRVTVKSITADKVEVVFTQVDYI